MIYLLPLSIFAVIIACMWIAERNNWGFTKRLGFTALIALPYTVIVFMAMATM
ncbi:hypothetical protein [Roseinatronobacter sp. NSM]|uniref:hypothetical protein n=1 Tax=Roseinatronobacter sp. NSM TaxID=3457785 RepID=UPI00403753CA